MIVRPTLAASLRCAVLCAVLFLVPIRPVRAQAEVAETTSSIDGVDYRVYDRFGHASSLLGIIGAAADSQVLLVGEEHDDMVGHAVETALFEMALEEFGRSDSASGRTVVLSLEIFERDVQYVLDEYLDDVISEAHFRSSSRPWDDYETRYRPLIEVAKTWGGPVVAANAPRRYVNRVSRYGPESLASLSTLAKSYLPPLPYPGPSDLYRAQWDSLMAAAMADESGAEAVEDAHSAPDDSVSGHPDHTGAGNAIHAQALWDASMGHAITTALVEHLGALVVHIAGSFHVERGTGIVERIEDYRPGTRVTTVVMTKVGDIDAWSVADHGALADFVVLTRQPTDSANDES